MAVIAIDPTVAAQAVEHSTLYVRFAAALDLMETKLVKLVASAPANGPTSNPKGPNTSPPSVPIIAPTIARRLAPTRFAPCAVAHRSMPSESRVSRPSTTSIGMPTCWKPSAQAASSMPQNTSGRPGSAGNTVPTRPTTASSAASR